MILDMFLVLSVKMFKALAGVFQVFILMLRVQDLCVSQHSAEYIHISRMIPWVSVGIVSIRRI